MIRGLAWSVVSTSLLIGAVFVNAADPPPLASPEGYFEGTAHFAKEVSTNVIGLSLTCKSDYWYTITRTGPNSAKISGEGIANYDFKFAVNWTVEKKVSFGLMKGIAVDLEPDVTIELDKSTSRLKFYLAGETAWPPNFDHPEFPLNVTWNAPGDKDAKPPKQKYNVVATVGAKMPALTIGQRPLTGKSFEIDPPAPFGGMSFNAKLGKRSPYGPYASEGSKDTLDGKVSIHVDWQEVQKIDFSLMRRMAELEKRERERTGQP